MIVKKLSTKNLKDARLTMKKLAANHVDPATNIVNLTSLTEETAMVLDLYEDSDFGIHSDLFELAGDLFPEDL